MKMKTRKKTASVARDLRVAASATATTNARNADAGLRAKASVATTTNARSVDAGLRAAAIVATTTNAKSVDVIVADLKDANAVAPKATVVELVTTKNADEVGIAAEKAASAKKAVAARASTAKRS